MKKKSIISLMIMVLMASIFTTPSMGQNLTNGNVYSTEESFQNITKGDLVEVDFEFEIPSEQIELSGFKLISFNNGVYTFEALRDMDEANIKLHYKADIKEEEEEHESGNSNSNDRPSEGEGTEIDWSQFALGKHDWPKGENDKLYAIRIDVNKYQEYDVIYLIDESEGLGIAKNLRVSRLVPDENGVVQNIGSADYEVINNEEGNLVLEIQIDKLEEEEKMRYDVVYDMGITNNIYNNKYKIITKREWEEIVSGGSGDGVTDDKPQAPQIPEDLEVEPPIGENSKPTERPKEEPKEEDVIDYPTIDQGTPISPTPPALTPKDEEDFTLIPGDDNNVVEREVDEEEMIEDSENIDEDDVIKEEDKEDNSAKEDVKIKFDEDEKDENQDVNKEENKEKQHKLPATGQSRNVAIFVIGVTLLIYGITLKRRG